MRGKRGPETLSINSIIKLEKNPGESQSINNIRRWGASHTTKGRANNTINKVLRKPSVTVKLVDKTPSKTAPIGPANNIIDPKLITNSINNALDIIMRKPRGSKLTEPGLIIIKLIKIILLRSTANAVTISIKMLAQDKL